jgi:DNA-binding CsgD family transcriptional regulator
MTHDTEIKGKRGFDMSEVLFGRRASTAALALFAVIVVLIGWDLVMDYQGGTDLLHLAVESLILLAAAAGAFWICLRFLVLRDATRLLRRDLEAAKAEARRWREESRDCLQGLGAAIDRQFVRWKLTPAEAEVGLLLLKGLSHKEAARARGTSERTVRQQARALYLKAGLAGRSELAAFFLEDLLLPRDDRG